jgi:hypothetical protein
MEILNQYSYLGLVVFIMLSNHFLHLLAFVIVPRITGLAVKLKRGIDISVFDCNITGKMA